MFFLFLPCSTPNLKKKKSGAFETSSSQPVKYKQPTREAVKYLSPTTFDYKYNSPTSMQIRKKLPPVWKFFCSSAEMSAARAKKHCPSLLRETHDLAQLLNPIKNLKKI